MVRKTRVARTRPIRAMVKSFDQSNVKLKSRDLGGATFPTITCKFN